jgi:hypothetical protein
MIAYEESELREAWRAVANSKLVEFRRQAWRLAVLVSTGKLKMADAVDGLWEIATAHALVRSLGEDRIQACSMGRHDAAGDHPFGPGPLIRGGKS